MMPRYVVEKDQGFYFQRGVNAFRKGLTRDIADDLPTHFRASFRQGWDSAAKTSPAMLEVFRAMKIS